MDIIKAASICRPGVAWNLRGTKLEQAEDGSPRVSLPTQEELNSVIASEAYKDLRKVAYPPIEDQLDAIWKGGTDMETMRQAILAIKAQYPKVQ